MDLNEILKASGFQIDAQNNMYVRSLGKGYAVEAYKNGDGIILHLVKDGIFIQPTTQTINPTDLAEAFDQLMNFLKLFVDSISNMNN